MKSVTVIEELDFIEVEIVKLQSNYE
jgi:hypothetical protein